MQRVEGTEGGNSLMRGFCQQVSSLHGQQPNSREQKDKRIQLSSENQHFSMESERVLQVFAGCRRSLVANGVDHR